MAFHSHLDPHFAAGEMMRVGLSDLHVSADIGINPEEIGVPQPLIVDLFVDLEHLPDGDLHSTIDYRDLSAIIHDLAAQRTGLIETFAQQICVRCGALANVSAVEVTVRKPQALTNGIAQTRLVWHRPLF